MRNAIFLRQPFCKYFFVIIFEFHSHSNRIFDCLLTFLTQQTHYNPYPTCVPQNSMEKVNEKWEMRMNTAPLFSPKNGHPFLIYWLLFNLTFNARTFIFKCGKSTSFWCKNIVFHIIWIIRRKIWPCIPSTFAWIVAFFELFAQKQWMIRRFEQ